MPLTAEQKERNKKALGLRQKAYSARRREYDAALNDALHAAQDTDVYREWNAANPQIDAILQDLDQKHKALREQIRQLENQISDLTKESVAKIEAIRTVRDQKGKAYFDLERGLKAEVDARYPDMASCTSVAGWKPIEDFIEQAQEDTAPNAPSIAFGKKLHA